MIQPGEFRVDEPQIELGVVDHQVRVLHEGQELRRNLGERRVRRKEFLRKPVDLERLVGHVAPGIDVAVKDPARGHAVDKFDAGELDDTVAGLGVETGCFGVQHNLTHVLFRQNGDGTR